MPVPPAPLPEALGGYFSTAEAQRAGANRNRLRAKDMTSPFHGVRRTNADVAAERKQLEEDTEPFADKRAARRKLMTLAKMYLPVMPAGAFICGRSAAVLRGYPVDLNTELDVATISPQRAPRAKGVAGRRVAAHLAWVDELDGIPIATPATIWTMLAVDHSWRELVKIGDAIVQIPRDEYGRQRPDQVDATIEQLEEAVNAGKHRHLKKLRRALSRIAVGCSSPLETDYRLDAEDAGLPLPDLDVEIYDAHGRRLGISEFVYPELKVIVEVEGDQHRTSKNQWNRDVKKYRDYANEGWEVVRLTNDDIRVRKSAVGTVRTVLLRRGWRPGE